jgi:hypothetical protein
MWGAVSPFPLRKELPKRAQCGVQSPSEFIQQSQNWLPETRPVRGEAHNEFADRDALHFHTRIVRRVNLDPSDLCVVVEWPVVQPGKKVDSRRARNNEAMRDRADDVRQSVLVVIGEAVEHPNAVFLGCVLQVRLHSVDDCLSFGGNRAYLPVSVTRITPPARSVLVDGKLRGIWGSSSREQRKLPNDVIERGAELLKALSNQDADSRRDFLTRYESVDAFALVLVEMRDRLIRIALQEGRDFSGEFVEVFSSPLDLETDGFKWMSHALTPPLQAKGGKRCGYFVKPSIRKANTRSV